MSDDWGGRGGRDEGGLRHFWWLFGGSGGSQVTLGWEVAVWRGLEEKAVRFYIREEEQPHDQLTHNVTYIRRTKFGRSLSLSELPSFRHSHDLNFSFILFYFIFSGNSNSKFPRGRVAPPLHVPPPPPRRRAASARNLTFPNVAPLFIRGFFLCLFWNSDCLYAIVCFVLVLLPTNLTKGS